MYLLALLPSVAACDDNEGPNPPSGLQNVFMRSDVLMSEEGLWFIPMNEPYETDFCISVDPRDEECPVYVLSGIAKEEDETMAAFWRNAERNDDTSYNRTCDWLV